MSRVLAVARRELLAYFHAPIAYVVIVLFLALEGFSFWAVVEVLADPARPAGYGAVLRTHFGGTFLYWAVLFAVVALLTMRLVAEERRAGTWESLLTTPVSEAEIVLGKWLGAYAFYLLLWLPTAVYPVVLAIYAPPGTDIDIGPIASAYLGVALSGAAFVSLGLAASAIGDNQVVAAVISFAGLLGLLLIGQLRALDGGPPGALVHHLDLRAHMDDLARGAIDLDAIALWGGLWAIGLALAIWACARGRGGRAAARRRALAVALVVADVVLLNAVAARHPLRWDTSAAGVNQLDPRTVAVLEVLPGQVVATVVRPEVAAYEPVYAEVDRLLDQMARAQPLLVRHTLDASREPDRVAELSAELALDPRDLADGGAVLFEVAGRRRGVDLLDLADFGKDALDAGAMVRFGAEEAFARALAELADPQRTVVCATSGHGEMSFVPDGARDSWAQVADRLRRAGMQVDDVGDVTGAVPDRCSVLVVAGPEVPLGPDAALEVDEYLRAGGRLLVVAGDRPAGGTRLPATGLELVLAERGISLPAALVVDPQDALDLPLAWATATGYGDHPITAAFRGRRYTVWQHPRVVALDPLRATDGVVLVHGSPVAWGETDLASLFAGRDVSAGPDDLVGISSVAVAVSGRDGSRLVALGSATSPSSAVAGQGLGSADALVAASVAWLAGRGAAISIGDKTPEHVRLVMTARERRAVFATCVVILPLLAAGLGGLLWWRRRRG